jgi:hypothetical protein
MKTYTLNATQNFYYLRAILGLGIYDRDEIAKLGYQKRKRIIKVHKRALKAINELKHERLFNLSVQYLNRYFNKGLLYNELVSEKYLNFNDDLPRVTMSDKDLGITKNDILNCLLEKGILGPNFLNLK